MYVDVPTNVSAMELINSPETPKSQIFICPEELHKMLDGLISYEKIVISNYQIRIEYIPR